VSLLVALPLLLVAALATAQLARPAPAAEVRLTMPATLTVPGTLAGIPWPAHGQARVDVDGLGSLGGAGGQTPVQIGSVAKIMTAYLVLTDHPLDAGAAGPLITVTASDVADYKARIPSKQSLVAVVEGEKLSERQALQALMLPSANNVAQMLANWDAGSPDAFVAKMNDTAGKLGLTATRYTDPSGFEPTTVSTAADQTTLAKAALRLPALAEIVAQPSATLPVAGVVRNYNSMLGTDGVFGIKTGSTDQAGGNLVFAAHLSVGGQSLTVVGAVLGQPGKETPEQLVAVSTATRQLLDAAQRLVRVYTLLPAGQFGQVRVPWGRSTPVRTAGALQVVGWPGLAFAVQVRTVPTGARVTAGERVASMTVHVKDDPADAGAATEASAVTVDLRTAGGLPGPSPWWRLTRVS
jgi:D-alanyl-D-alanine carboxypeptidase (penicillin-binding protein 5/6)